MSHRMRIPAAAILLCPLAAQCAAPRIYERNLPATLCIVVEGELYNGQTEQASAGSAFFLNNNVYALTNDHVIPDANLYRSMKITGRLRVNPNAKDRTVNLTVVARDPKMDLAVLRADAPIPSKYVFRGDSRRMRVGDELIVLGCPLDLGPSLTSGRLGNVRDEPSGRWLTEAAINPGNSGGPIFNAAGKVVGIASGSLRRGAADGPEIFGINIVVPMHMALGGILKTANVETYDTFPRATSIASVASDQTLGGFSIASREIFNSAAAVASIDAPMTAAAAPPQPSPSPSPSAAPHREPPGGAAGVPPAAGGPLAGDMQLPASGSRKQISRAFEIRQTKDDHAVVGSTQREYRLKFQAEPGYTIAATKFQELSRNNGSTPQVTTSSDKKTVEVIFTLTSGPAIDRFRGWLAGTLVTQQVSEGR
ncbi:MAG: putative Serine protease do-like precursor [Hyphomicrobiales bacterium]|nr:putative Serine protease do-like precursor [Hyphomicrobiales bacterium]